METRRGQKIAIAVLAALTVVAIALLVYGMSADNDSFAILGYCIGLPVFFALLVNVGILLAWTDRR